MKDPNIELKKKADIGKKHTQPIPVYSQTLERFYLERKDNERKQNNYKNVAKKVKLSENENVKDPQLEKKRREALMREKNLADHERHKLTTVEGIENIRKPIKTVEGIENIKKPINIETGGGFKF